MLAAKAPGAAGRVFNIATGKTYSIIDLVNEIEKIAGSPLKYSHTEPRKGDPRRTQADITKAKDTLKYETEVSFGEGLRRTWDWFKKTSC